MVLSLSGNLAKVCAAIAVTCSVPIGSARAEEPSAGNSQSDANSQDSGMTDPAVMRQVFQKMRAQEKLERTKAMLRGHKDQLYKSGAPEIGNPDAKVTIVAFLDYNCPYCRSTYAMLRAFINENTDTKLVVRDTASLGKDSESVGRIVLAARNQGKFEVMHDAMMGAKGKLGEQQALGIAAKLGLDVPRLTADAQSPDVGTTMAASQDLAKQLKVLGVPLYIVGYRGIGGASDDFVKHIARFVEEIRTSGCDVC